MVLIDGKSGRFTRNVRFLHLDKRAALGPEETEVLEVCDVPEGPRRSARLGGKHVKVHFKTYTVVVAVFCHACHCLFRMGLSASKLTVEKDESRNKVELTDSSTGVHLIEIHTPMVGISVMTVIFMLAVCVGLWYVCHRLRRSRCLREARRGVQDFPMKILRANNPVVSAVLHGMQQGLQAQQQPQLPALGKSSASGIDVQVV